MNVLFLSQDPVYDTTLSLVVMLQWSHLIYEFLSLSFFNDLDTFEE